MLISDSGFADLSDPLADKSWADRISCFREATVFHSVGWLATLAHVYGHTPMALLTDAKELSSPVFPVVEVNSRWTGRRGVCVPFADECGPLGYAGKLGLFRTALDRLERVGRQRGWRYLEWRADSGHPEAASESMRHWGHRLDLRPGSERLMSGFSPEVRRAIRKAERSGLEVKIGRSEADMMVYYRLHCATRRRHGAPPQPVGFFRELHRRLVVGGQGFVVTVVLGSVAVAGGVFLHLGKRALYKFGGSTAEAGPLRANNLMMWEGIKHLVQGGFEELEFGRTSASTPGLMRFKAGWGCQEYAIAYYRANLQYAQSAAVLDPAVGWQVPILRRLPESWLRLIGALTYPHMS